MVAYQNQARWAEDQYVAERRQRGAQRGSIYSAEAA